MRTGTVRATPRLCRAAGWRTQMSVSPAAMRALIAVLMSRVDCPSQSTMPIRFLSGCQHCMCCMPMGGARSPLREHIPRLYCPGQGFPRLHIFAEGCAQGHFLRGNGDKLVGLGDDQRLEAERVFGKAQLALSR